MYQGNFSDDEFTLLAYYAAMSPGVVELKPDPIDAVLTKEERLYTMRGHWTTDIGQNGFHPRERMGLHYFDIGVVPARKAAEQMIRDHEDGKQVPDNKSIAYTLANGIDSSIMSILQTNAIRAPYAVNTMVLNMLQKTEKMLKERQDLSAQVFEKLGPDKTRIFRGLMSYKRLMDEGYKAEARLTREEKGEIRISPEEKEELRRKVATFESYAGRLERFWIRELDRIDPDISRVTADINRRFSGNTAAAMILPATMVEAAKKKKFPENIIDELLSQDSNKEYERSDRTIGHLQDFFDRIRGEQKQALEITARDAGHRRYTDQITGEEYYQADRTAKISTEKLSQLLTSIEGRMKKEGFLTDVLDSYNAIAREKGWDELNPGGGRLAIAGNGEKLDTYFHLMMTKIKRHPVLACEIETDIENCKHPAELPLEQIVIHPAESKIKKIISQNAGLSDENRAYLQLANMLLKNIPEKMVMGISSVEEKDHAVFLEDERILRQSEGYNGDKETFDGIVEMKATFGEMFESEVIPKDAANKYTDFLNHPAKMSPDTEKKAIDIISMMEKGGMIGDVLAVESGDKIYSHMRTVQANINLNKALDGGNLEAIRNAVIGYQNAYRDEKQVFDAIKSAFGEDALNIPGNVSSLRESRVPADFSRDVVTDSRMNGLYMVGAAAKLLGVSVTTLLKNPGKTIMSHIKDAIENHGVKSMVRDEDNFLSCFQKLYDAGKSENIMSDFNKKALGGVSGSFFVNRVLDGIYRLETDPDRKKEIMAYQRKLCQYADAAMERERNCILSVYTAYDPSAPVTNELRKEMNGRMKQAFLESRSITKRNLPVAYTDENGVDKDRPRTYGEVLATKGLYQKLISRFKKNVSVAEDIEMAEPKEIIVEAMFDYLKAHPEDMMTKDYKALEKVALSARQKLGLPEPADEAARENTPEAEYRRWRNDLQTEERTLENQVRVRDLELNRDLEEERRALKSSANHGTLTEESLQILSRMTDSIITRQKELIDAYDRREITNSYFNKRYETLQNFLKEPVNGKLSNPPKLVDRTDPALYENDIKRLNSRISFSFGSRELKSLDAFKEWKRNSVNEAERAGLQQLTSDQWKRLYREHQKEVNSMKPRKEALLRYQREAESIRRNRKNALQKQQQRVNRGPNLGK